MGAVLYWRHLENPRPVPNSVHAASMMSRCAVVDADGDPAHTMILVSLMEEEYEKNTSSAEGLVDYRAAGLLVSGCKRGEEQLERPVQSSYQEKLNEHILSTGRKISVTQVVLVSSDTRSKG